MRAVHEGFTNGWYNGGYVERGNDRADKRHTAGRMGDEGQGTGGIRARQGRQDGARSVGIGIAVRDKREVNRRDFLDTEVERRNGDEQECG